MPLYEYECKACHKRTEKIQKFSDPEITVCPLCGGELERTITAPAFQFAGGGWYKDGYGNAKPPAAGGSEGSSEGTTPAAASDAKPSSGDSGSTTPAAPAAPAPAPSTPAASAPASAAPAPASKT